ncbi:MAG: hypothetical protein ACKO96_37285 [Flammeovirgaceae bacterium]
MFDKQITEYNENILALRDFADTIRPVLLEKKKHVDNEHGKRLKALTSKAMFNQIKTKLPQSLDKDSEEYTKMIDYEKKIDDKLMKLFNESVEVSFSEVHIDEEKHTIEMKGLTISGKGAMGLRSLEEQAEKTEKHIHLLNQNTLISLLSSVEWFFSQILHYHFSKNPESAGIGKKTLTLSDIKSLGSIEDAESFLIDSKIEEILRGNFESWITSLKTELHLSMGYVDSCLDDLIEINQRRNLIIHNGGVVNSIYLNKVPKSAAKIGDKLTVDDSYLDNAICKFHLVFILIAAELWKKLEPQNKERGTVLIEITYENLLSKRWDITEGLSYFIKNDSKMEIIDKTVSQLNYWLARKRQGHFESIKKEFNDIDFSDKDAIFQLGLASLRENVDDFFELLPKAIDSKSLTIDRLKEFPIFEEMRGTKKYQEFLDSQN